jgi:ubiquinone/menaquinone biosynthesis C-methylase UbiE
VSGDTTRKGTGSGIGTDCRSNAWDLAWADERKEFGSPVTRLIRADQKAKNIVRLGLDVNRDSVIGDLGCGTGEVLEKLLEQFAVSSKNIYAFDLSSVALRRFRQRSDYGRQAHLISADVKYIPMDDDVFDVIVCLGVLEHVNEPDKLLAELHRVLKIGGCLFLSQSNKYSIFDLDRRLRLLFNRWPYGFQKNLTPRQLSKILSGHFKIQKVSVDMPSKESPIYRLIDQLFRCFWNKWGRTIFIKGTKQK